MSEYRSLSDAELFALLCSNDHRAFTEIYDRYSAVLYVHAYKRIRCREEAKDLIHELFTVLWHNRAKLVLKSNLSSYLYTSVRNRVIDRANHSKIETHYLNFSRSDLAANRTNTTDHVVRQKELALLIEKEIDGLPEKMRAIFNLSRKADLSHKEISEQLNISELTVRKQINNALKVLRPRLTRLFSVLF